MRRWIAAPRPVRAAAAAALVAAALAVTPVSAADADVDIQNFAYSPATVTITVGDTVTWTNLDSVPHTATDAGVFDTGFLMQDQSGSFTFSEAGTFNYICTVHPDMAGTVIVQEDTEPTDEEPTDEEPTDEEPTDEEPTDDEGAATDEPTLPATDTIDPALAASAGVALPAVILVLIGIALVAYVTLPLPRRRD